MNEENLTPKKRRFDYSYVILALCFLMVMVSLGFASSTKSLFPDEIARALEVERTLVSFNESFRYIATAIVNLFFGALIAKFGPKKLILAGFASLTSSMILYSIATKLWMLYIAGALLGIGFSWTTTTMVGYVVGIWASKNKGTIMGAILASNGLGGAISIPLVGSLINPEVIGSYRAAYRLIAVVLFSTMLVLLIFFRDKPKNAEESPVSTGEKKRARGRDWEGIPFSQAVRRPAFWCILVSIFLSGMILQGVSEVAVMHMKDIGLDYGAIMGMLSFGSLLLATSKFLTGFLYDRFGLRLTTGFCMTVAVIAACCLALLRNDSIGYLLAIIYVIVSRFALPLETIMLPLYASDLFGQKDFAKVLGIFVSANVTGYALGAPILNRCYDMLGTYAPALYVFAGLMIFNLIMTQIIVSREHKRNADAM